MISQILSPLSRAVAEAVAPLRRLALSIAESTELYVDRETRDEGKIRTPETSPGRPSVFGPIDERRKESPEFAPDYDENRRRSTDRGGPRGILASILFSQLDTDPPVERIDRSNRNETVSETVSETASETMSETTSETTSDPDRPSSADVSIDRAGRRFSQIADDDFPPAGNHDEEPPGRSSPVAASNLGGPFRESADAPRATGFETMARLDVGVLDSLANLPSAVESALVESDGRRDELLERQLEVQEEIRDALTTGTGRQARFGS